jgi:type II secretory pathway pseudopilin PulG
MKLLANTRRRAAAPADEDGFVLIEAVIAAFILILAAVAIFDAYDASSRATFRAQATQVELSQAQKEMETIRTLPYTQIALTSEPARSTVPTSPLNRVNTIGQFNLASSGSTNYAPMVWNGSPKDDGTTVDNGTIDPGPETFQSGDLSGTIWRFVVWQSDTGCPPQTCSGQDLKRVIVVVQPDATAAGGTRPYIELHSDFIDPTANSMPAGVPPGGSGDQKQQFWLSDTPCDPNIPTIRQDITAPHLLHNTLGDCRDGKRTGATPGAPDALLTSAPPGDLTDPYYDYQTELNPPPPGTDEGIQIVPEVKSTPPDPPNPPCKWMADGSPDPQTRFHVWLGDEIPPTNQPFELSGPVSLTFYSRTLNGTDPAKQFPGKICIWLFRRTPGGSDILFGGGSQSASWTYSSGGNWPADYGDPSDELPIPIVASADLGKQKVNPNSRLGLAISVAPDVTPYALELMYDHPLFPSRLDVDTTTPLDTTP